MSSFHYIMSAKDNTSPQRRLGAPGVKSPAPFTPLGSSLRWDDEGPHRPRMNSLMSRDSLARSSSRTYIMWPEP